MKRVVATAPAAQAAAKDVQATPRVERNPRRVMAGAGDAGLGAAGAAAAGDAPGLAAGFGPAAGPPAPWGPVVVFLVSSVKARPCS